MSLCRSQFSCHGSICCIVVGVVLLSLWFVGLMWFGLMSFTTCFLSQHCTEDGDADGSVSSYSD